MVSASKNVWIGFLLVILFANGCSSWNTFKKDGELQLAGLKAPVTVKRDEKGMAYIYAQNLDDALMAQGFVSAQDRLFQMELNRMFSTGRISELAGEGAVALDTRMRTIGFLRHAKKKAQLLDSKSRSFIQKYIDGVNAFIETRRESHHLEFKLAGIKPTTWSIEDSLAIVYYLSWDTSANLNTEIIMQMLIEKIGYERAMEIAPLNINPDDPPEASAEVPTRISRADHLGLAADKLVAGYLEHRRRGIGSNNWAVKGQHSSGGKPIVANDPHLDARILPGPLYPCGIITPNLRVVGVTPAGVPGMIIFRNANVALGLTNAYGDTQDLYIETLDPNNEEHYLDGDRSLRFKIIEETLKIKDKKADGGYKEKKIKIRLTKRGPVISDIFPDLKTDKVLSLRWSLVENMGPKIGFNEILKSKSVAEVREALKDVDFLMLNFTFADADGHIGWQVSGKLPLRSNGGGTIPTGVIGGQDNWTGFVSFDAMPQIYNPQRGWVGTCNHYTITKDYPYYYSNYMASSYRYRRLKQLLDTRSMNTPEDHWRYQRDTLNLMAQKIAPMMSRALMSRKETKLLGQILDRWDYHDDPDLAAPTIFQAVYRQFARLVFEDELGEDLAKTMLGSWYFWQERLQKMLEDGDSPWFDRVDTVGKKETRDELFQQAALDAASELESSLGKKPEKWTWGKVHRLELVSPIRREGFGKGLVGGGSHPALGSGETIGRGIYDFNDPYEVKIFASLRMVADLSDDDKVLAVLPGGVSGRLFSEHTKDQVEAFINGDKVYWWFSDEIIERQCQNTLVLTP